MHSKIIYLIENENELTNSFGGQLPLEYLITNETLYDYIDECDYVESNYSNEESDCAEELDSIYKEVFEDSNYFELKQNIQGVYEVSINHKNLINWDKRYLEICENYSTKIRQNLLNNEFTKNEPFDNFQEYFEFQEMNANDIGGVKFVIYRDIDGELDFDTMYNIRDLICYVKYRLEHENKEKIEYQICTNVLGDYHY